LFTTQKAIFYIAPLVADKQGISLYLVKPEAPIRFLWFLFDTIFVITVLENSFAGLILSTMR
jgi:hypothetical protein